jgi:predicted AlkP superfamily phosphohydrolase/phosphomutase
VLAGVGAWAATAARGYLPNTIPVVKNPLKAAPFWEIAAQAGVVARVLDAGQAWDREPVANANVLCGLGVPDAHGSYTSFYVYTTDELYFARRFDDDASDTSSGGTKLRVDERDGVIESEIFGPVNFCREAELAAELEGIAERRKAEPNMSYKAGAKLDEREDEIEAEQGKPITLPLRIVKKGKAATVTMGSQSQEIAEGAWSDWYRLTFELNPLIKVHAIARAKIVHLDDPYFEMYVDTLHYDPASPPFWQPLSEPPSYAPELAKTIQAPFETVGWACMTHPFKDEVIDAVTFLEDIEFTTRWREELTFAELKKDDWKLFMSCFSEPDRVQHMMYQYYDPTHPLYDAEKAARKVRFYGEEVALKDAIPAIYKQVDRLVGRVMNEAMKTGDTLILCADHGFQSFRRQVHLNNWLAKEGYLVTQEPLERGRASLLSFYVDWSKTRAYSLGLGMVFVNEKRPGSDVGIVDPKDKQALLREIAAKLVAATDPDDGRKFVKSAAVIRDIHQGPHVDLEADLMVGFEAGYRISWISTGGGIATGDGEGGLGPVVVDNDKNWSGDHVSVDTELVRGMFLCNRKIQVPDGGVDLLHVAPTVLAACGVPVPAEMDVKPLKFLD